MTQPLPHEDITRIGDVEYYHRLTQGSQEWHDLRRGMITGSMMNSLITPATLKIANNKDTRTAIYQLAALRAGLFPEDHFQSYAMERGHLEEVEARIKYANEYEDVSECGFVINRSLGFPVGFSPDGLIGDLGMMENKSRDPKFQMQTIIEHIADENDDVIPREYMLQVQTGLWVTGRQWCDFTSYSNGFNMLVIRVLPIPIYQTKIAEAAKVAEKQVQECVRKFKAAMADDDNRIIPVEWIDHSQEILA